MRFANAIYILLLLYVMSALSFWGVRLLTQAREEYTIELHDLQHHVDSIKSPVVYQQKLSELGDEMEKRRSQYFGEGGTLLCILVVGAVVVFTSLQRHARLQKQQSNFMLAVTHELKSPIAGMKLSIQTLQRHQLGEEQKAQLLNRCIEEADRLSELCNNMLVTSQIEGRQYKSAAEQLLLSDLVNECGEVYSRRYPRRLLVEVEEGCVVNGDMLLLHLAVNNLLENAIKYTPADAPITLRLARQSEKIVLEVADRGAGIPDHEKRKIFSKFYRIGDEATRRSKGTGLGLYLTKRIAKQHKGSLSVRDNQPTGSVFQITFPGVS